MNNPHPAAAYLERRNRNLAFFAGNYPGIYEFFKDYKLQKVQLDIRPEAGEVDLIENGRHVYGGYGKAYGIKEAKAFSDAFPEGKLHNSMEPLFQGEYKNPRFFARQMQELYHYTPLTRGKFRGYRIESFLPLTVCLGVGLGWHIQSLLERRDVRHLLVVEHDMDRFAASLYGVDWQLIVEKQRSRPGHDIQFVLINNAANWYDVRATIWNHLINYVPFFPVTTYFYNHQGRDEYGQVIDDINRDIYVHLYSFGNYDDEVNQLNNAIHNFCRPVKTIGAPQTRAVDKEGPVGVCLVGSGPSLDTRIEDLRRLKEHCVVVSCGTGLGALLSHNIFPDFHVELESDHLVFRSHSSSPHHDSLKKLRLVGSAQLSPPVIDLFGEARLFFKKESPLSGLFGQTSETISDAAPTCTNAGIAIAAHFKADRIFLFGIDYGFPDAASHHAKGSIYYVDEAHQRDEEQIRNQQIEVDAAPGGNVKSTSFLFTSKRRTENVIVATGHKAIFNCSNGARIEGTQWLDSADLDAQLSVQWADPNILINTVFSKDGRLLKKRWVEKKARSLLQQLKQLCAKCLKLLDSPPSSIEELVDQCSAINRHLQQELQHQNPSFYYFCRGSLWHFLHAGYSHAAALNGLERRMWINWWHDCLCRFLEGWPDHLRQRLDLSFKANLEATWLSRSITEPESEEFAHLRVEEIGSWECTDWVYDEQRGFLQLSEVAALEE